MYMASEPAIAPAERIDSLILTVRGQRVMLDSALARVYGILTKRLKEQFRRNRDRFPSYFAFQITNKYFENFRSKYAT